jgi:hypothetical protein
MCAAEMQPGGHRDRRPSDPEPKTATVGASSGEGSRGIKRPCSFSVWAGTGLSDRPVHIWQEPVSILMVQELGRNVYLATSGWGAP